MTAQTMLIQSCDDAGNDRVCAKCPYTKVCRLYVPRTRNASGPSCSTKVPDFDYKSITPSVLTEDDDENVAPI